MAADYIMFEFGPRPTYESNSSFSPPAEIIIMVIVAGGNNYNYNFLIPNYNYEYLYYHYQKAISDIGTKILFKPCFSHNSTHKAPPELIPELIGTKFHVDSEFNVKT